VHTANVGLIVPRHTSLYNAQDDQDHMHDDDELVRFWRSSSHAGSRSQHSWHYCFTVATHGAGSLQRMRNADCGRF